MNDNETLAIHPDTRKAILAFEKSPSHAVALVGIEGLGKTILAREIAAHTLGLTQTALISYPYFRTITPQDGVISISQMRDIRSFFTLTIPQHEKRTIARIVVVEDADRMTREAQNAFLKLLEEPPENAMCILTLASPQKILQTVWSRLQKIPVHKPGLEGILQAFRPLDVERKEVERALLLAGGNISAAHGALEHAGDAAADTIVERVKATLASDMFTRLAMVDGLITDRETAGKYVDVLLLTAEASLRQAGNIDPVRLKRWQQILQAAHRAQTALSKKGNLKLVFTELMLSL